MRSSESRANDLLEQATRAYAADRYQDTLRLLRKLAAQAPGSAPVRELLGLTLYRLGRWTAALHELEAHQQLSGSYDQYPVIADCYRALHRYDDADRLWTELRQASPSAELMAEGRLVAAGALADRGDLKDAIGLLESSLRRSKPKPLHLRQWYTLADLLRAGGRAAKGTRPFRPDRRRRARGVRRAPTSRRPGLSRRAIGSGCSLGLLSRLRHIFVP